MEIEKKGRNHNLHPPLPPGKRFGMLIACQALYLCQTETFKPWTERGSERVKVACKKKKNATELVCTLTTYNCNQKYCYLTNKYLIRLFRI